MNTSWFSDPKIVNTSWFSDPKIVNTSKVFRSENSVHFQDKNLYHVLQSSYSEKLRTGGPGGEAHRESRGVWEAARPPNNSKSRATGQNRKPGKISFLLGKIFEPGICKLPGKFGNLAGFLEPGQVLSERPAYNKAAA